MMALLWSVQSGCLSHRFSQKRSRTRSRHAKRVRKPSFTHWACCAAASDPACCGGVDGMGLSVPGSAGPFGAVAGSPGDGPASGGATGEVLEIGFDSGNWAGSLPGTAAGVSSGIMGDGACVGGRISRFHWTPDGIAGICAVTSSSPSKASRGGGGVASPDAVGASPGAAAVLVVGACGKVGVRTSPAASGAWLAPVAVGGGTSSACSRANAASRAASSIAATTGSPRGMAV